MNNDVGIVRLYLLRAMFALMCIGEGSIIWPLMFHHPTWSVMHSVACSLLAALTLLAGLGVRYPLQMMPLMLFEFVWKTIWVLMIAVPLFRSNQMNPEAMETFIACMMGVVLCPLVIPWKFVWMNYVTKRGDPWIRRGHLTAA